MCKHRGRYHLVGIISSGKGSVMSYTHSRRQQSLASTLCILKTVFWWRCGVYPGLYTEVSRYVSWIEKSLQELEDRDAIVWQDYMRVFQNYGQTKMTSNTVYKYHVKLLQPMLSLPTHVFQIKTAWNKAKNKELCKFYSFCANIKCYHRRHLDLCWLRLDIKSKSFKCSNVGFIMECHEGNPQFVSLYTSTYKNLDDVLPPLFEMYWHVFYSYVSNFVLCIICSCCALRLKDV